MRCPVDRHFMLSRGEGEATHFRCPACGGLWFSRDALNAVDRDAVVSASVAGGAGTSAAIEAPRRLPCRTCMEPLILRRLGDAEIDVCGRCGGVWLDAGELPLVVEWYRVWYTTAAERGTLPGNAPPPPPRRLHRAVGADEVFDVALSVLGFVLEVGVSVAVNAAGSHLGGHSGHAPGGGTKIGGGGGFAGGGGGRSW